jgi:hypothetical protein
MTLKELQRRHNKRMKQLKKRNAHRIVILPRLFASLDIDSNNHHGIKHSSKKRPEALKPTWAI